MPTNEQFTTLRIPVNFKSLDVTSMTDTTEAYGRHETERRQEKKKGGGGGERGGSTETQD